MNKMYNFAYKTLENHLERMCTEVRLIKEFSHNGEKGREAEGILKNFLSKMLPERVTAGTGFVMDNRNNHSNQLDIIIYDSYCMPPIFKGYENSIIHIDSLNVVIESKLTYRNSTDIVLTSQKSANKVKRMSLGELETKEFVEGVDNKKYGEYHNYSKHFPYSKGDLLNRESKKLPLCILFAYTTDVASKDTVLNYLNNKKNLIDKDDVLPHHSGLDILCILDVGLFVWQGGKYVSFFEGEADNNKLFSTLYYLINNHIQKRERGENDFISEWFTGLVRYNMSRDK